MDIFQTIKLFRRNLLLLIAVPFIFAGGTYLFIQNQEKVFQSEAVIYTGIATGYSIESPSQSRTDYFTTSAQFDNMINLLKSRQTLIETSLQLISQDLSLDYYDAQYISNVNYDELQISIPQQVKSLVVNSNIRNVGNKKRHIDDLKKEIKSLEREVDQSENLAAQNKIIEKGIVTSTNNSDGSVGRDYHNERGSNGQGDYFIDHVVQQGESLSSLAQRYGVSRGQIMWLNNLNVSIITPGQTLVVKIPPKADNRYHIIKSGETLYSIAKKYGINISKLRELNGINNRPLTIGQKLLISKNQPDLNYGYSQDYSIKQVSDELSGYNSVIPDLVASESKLLTNKEYDYEGFANASIVPIGVLPSDFEKTLANITNFYSNNDTNFIYGLVHDGESQHYSVKSIGEIQIYRINNSDLVQLIYKSDDPGICQQTLKIMSKVFMKNYKLLRSNETSLVVKYFEEQVDSADKKLQAAEDKLLQFNKKNNIINYYEQSKAIAGQKEALDLYYQNEQIRLASSVATIKELELNLTARDSIYLKSDVLVQLKKELSQVTESIVLNEIATQYDERVVEQLDILKKRQQELRDDIKFYVDQLYLYSHSNQGLPIKNLLDQWLLNTINYEEAKAALLVLARRKQDFVKIYQRFAPLGATLKRIERDIMVTSQAYLELLRSLNTAKMKQQNEEMSTNIKMVDEPFFPITPNPSKAKLIVLAAIVFGFLLTAFIILMLEYFDASMKNPSRAAKATKMKLAGAFPRLSSQSKANELAIVSRRLIDIIIQNIKLSFSIENSERDNRPYIIAVFSTQNHVGKTIISERVVNRLREIGDNVLYLNYSSDIDEEADFNNSFVYEITDNFVDIENLQQLISSRYLRKTNKSYNYIFIEFPSIVYNTYPIKLIGSVDLSLYIINAADKLEKADLAALETYYEAASSNPMVILNEVELHNLDEILTDIPGIVKLDTESRIKRILAIPFKYRINIKRKA